MDDPKLLGVYTAQFPFLDTEESKMRPVVVVGRIKGEYNIVAIVPISSKSKREEIDIVLAQWKSEGLLKPSVARVHRLTAILQSDLIAELGVLQQKDAQTLQNALRIFLNIQS